jgi:putative ABC transport system permease protein
MRIGLSARLALRNLMRHKRRNALSGVAIVVGCFALIMGNGLVDGIDKVTLRLQEDTMGGHVLLRPTDYPSKGRNFPLDKATPPDAPLAKRLATASVEAWTQRLFFRARLIQGGSSLRIKVLAYDPLTDPDVFPREGWGLEGRWPGENELALGSGLAKLMGTSPDERVVLEARTRQGAINAMAYTVSGIVAVGNPAIDAMTLWLPMETAEELVRSEGARSHISIRLRGGRGAAEGFKIAIPSDGGWTATTAEEEMSDFMEINRFRRRAFSFISLIMMAIAATGIANTIVMAAYERIPEIGTLRSMGMQGSEVRAMFLLEGTCLGVIAGLVGCLAGGVLNYHLSVTGFDLSQAAKEMGELPMPTYMYTHFSFGRIAFALGFGVCVSLLASLWPASVAVRIGPAEAVRRN